MPRVMAYSCLPEVKGTGRIPSYYGTVLLITYCYNTAYCSDPGPSWTLDLDPGPSWTLLDPPGPWTLLDPGPWTLDLDPGPWIGTSYASGIVTP